MSSGSESDEDYVPGEPEKVSEEESANEETDLQFEKELEQKAKKRKNVTETKGTKKRKTRNGAQEKEESPTKEIEESEPVQNPEEEKKKEDDLWAKFLEGTDTKPKPTSTVTSTSVNTPTKPVVSKPEVPTAKSNDDQAREKRIFEFAGETIVVENNTIKERIKTADSPATGSKLEGPSRSRALGGSGLSGILGQINKKNKLSTLEKSKLDWSTYKQEEGLEEEIQSHNKGRNGYLDKRDFLERADVRQYEIERDMRLNRRSNR